MNQIDIVMIGAGNVATHLSKALSGAGHQLKQVYSRTKASANKLANELKSEAVSDIQLIDNKADLYIFSVSDNAIPELVQSIDISNKRVVHTAGSVPLSVFKGAKNHGVFYPLQTFSKNRKIDFTEIPVCIEADNKEFNHSLTLLAGQLTKSVWQINSQQRKQLHLSAVFACNFVNHLYSISKELIKEKGIGYEILHPLIKETALKATEMDPQLAQTGPAARNDTESIEKHIELLSSSPEIQEIYKIISKSIYLKNSNL